MAVRSTVEALRSERRYEPHVSLDPEYAPLIRRGVPLHLQCSSKEFPVKRLLGCKNVDLWVDRSLYPRDPVSGVSPSFRNLKGLVEFCCHGESGLLGYTKNLGNSEAGEVVRLQQTIASERVQSTIVREQLLEECSNLRRQLEEAGAAATSALVIQERSLSASHAETLRELMAEHQSALRKVEHEHAHTRSTMHFLQRQVASNKRAVELRTRRRAPLGSLAHASGNAKKWRVQIRALLNPREVEEIQDGNREAKKRKRVWGDNDSKEMNVVALAKMLSRKEKSSLLDTPGFEFVATQIANDTIGRIGASIDAEPMLAACDESRVFQRGYGLIVKTVRNRISLVDKRLNGRGLLPNPHKVRL